MIYCVEDEKNIRELLIYTLETTGFSARGMANSKELKDALKEELPDLILLDIMLPGEDGYSILERLKASSETKNIPVIMVTAKEAEYDKVRGLEAGAEKVELTRKEFELLQYLMENKGLVMTRNQILCHVWGYDFDGETRTVDVHVRTLRQKLGEAGNLIETVRGVGYRIGA